MHTCFQSFLRDAPEWFDPSARCDPSRYDYKFFISGKGCTLGVLFEDSIHVYFEWLSEDGRLVDYGAEIRYRFWPKSELSRLVENGVWEPAATFGA